MSITRAYVEEVVLSDGSLVYEVVFHTEFFDTHVINARDQDDAYERLELLKQAYRPLD